MSSVTFHGFCKVQHVSEPFDAESRVEVKLVLEESAGELYLRPLALLDGGYQAGDEFVLTLERIRPKRG